MDTNCKLYFKRDNIYQLRTSNSLVHYQLRTSNSLVHYQLRTSNSLVHYQLRTSNSLVHYQLRTSNSLVHYQLCTSNSLVHSQLLCPPLNRLVGLVVKTSASRAEDPGVESRLRRDFSGARVIPVTSKLALQWLPCQAPGVIGSALGLVGPVSVTVTV